MSRKQSNSSPVNAGAKTAPVKPSAARPTKQVAEVKPTREAVQRRAYELYRERAERGVPGTPEGDWLRAERELSPA